MKVLVEAQ